MGGQHGPERLDVLTAKRLRSVYVLRGGIEGATRSSGRMGLRNESGKRPAGGRIARAKVQGTVRERCLTTEHQGSWVLWGATRQPGEN